MTQSNDRNADIFNQLLKYFEPNMDTLKYSVLPLVLLISAFNGLRFWTSVEIVLSLVVGVVLCVSPQQILNLQMKGTIDSYHLFLCSLLGCYVVYTALFPFILKKSKDESILISHFWMRIISCNLMFITMFFAYQDGLRWNYTLLCLSGGPVLITMLVNAYFLMNSTSIRSQNHGNLPANTVAKFEFFMLLSAGLVLFAFPDHAMLELRNPSESHRLLCRLCGILLFSLSFESFTMPSFLFETDKQNFFVGRLLGSLLELAVIFVGRFYFNVFKTNQTMVLLVSVNMSYNLLIIAGYWSCLTRVRTLKKKADINYNEASMNSSLNSSVNISTVSDKKAL